MDKIINLPFVKAFLKMIADLTDYKGRTSRADFWWAVLGVVILSVPVFLICSLLGGFGDWLYRIFCILMFIPQLAMWVRRLHDVNMSGLFMLLMLTGVGCIPLVVFACLDGTQGDNKYGPDPRRGYGF